MENFNQDLSPKINKKATRANYLYKNLPGVRFPVSVMLKRKFVGLEKANVKHASLQPGALERPAPFIKTHTKTGCEGTKGTDVKAYFRR